MSLAPATWQQMLFAAIALPVLAAQSFAQTEPEAEPSVRAVSKAMPAVVNINTERIVKRTFQDPREAFFREYFGGPMRPPRQMRQKVQSLGSGFFVDATGYIVTNEHVVERAEDLKIQVTTSDGKSYSATYIAGDEESDIAFIKVNPDKPVPFIELSEPSPNLLGQTVLALGNPLGYGSSVSRGILSAVNRTITINEQEFKNLLQTDAAINPGNSGGPLIDLQARLVGVNSVKMAYTPQGVPTQGLGFAIPAALIRQHVGTFMADVKNPKPAKVAAATPNSQKFFGLQVQDLSEDLSDALGLEIGRGVVISDVETDSPADEAGLRRGQVIYRVGRYDIGTAEQLETLLAKARSGTVADFVIGAPEKTRGRISLETRTLPLTAR